MKIIINYPNEWVKDKIKKYGIRKVRQAIKNNILESVCEWDMDACIETDIGDQEEADKIIRKQK